MLVHRIPSLRQCIWCLLNSVNVCFVQMTSINQNLAISKQRLHCRLASLHVSNGFLIINRQTNKLANLFFKNRVGVFICSQNGYTEHKSVRVPFPRLSQSSKINQPLDSKNATRYLVICQLQFDERDVCTNFILTFDMRFKLDHIVIDVLRFYTPVIKLGVFSLHLVRQSLQPDESKLKLRGLRGTTWAVELMCTLHTDLNKFFFEALSTLWKMFEIDSNVINLTVSLGPFHWLISATLILVRHIFCLYSNRKESKESEIIDSTQMN